MWLIIKNFLKNHRDTKLEIFLCVLFWTVMLRSAAKTRFSWFALTQEPSITNV